MHEVLLPARTARRHLIAQPQIVNLVDELDAAHCNVDPGAQSPRVPALPRFRLAMRKNPYLIVPLMQAFCWFDDGLQARLQAKGWGHVSRPQSMVMVNILSGVRRPSDIARNVGVSRQAMHSTLNQMIEMGMLELQDDPEDGRSKLAAITAMGQRMRRDADAAVDALTAELERRIGKANVANLFKAFQAEWGSPATNLTPATVRRSKS
jgi:DNA-binding MarR family transcriptional regulator